jgi:hypothetical protein
MLEKIIEFLSNPLYSLLLATAIGIASNILTGKAFERTKRLWWGVSPDWLNYFYFDETNKLRISYNGLDNKRKEIKQSLSVLRFVIWSQGKDSLRNDDISSKEPLIISLEQNTEILEIRQIVSTNPTLQVAPINKNSLLLDFEYLKTNQGIVFDVIVSGFASQASLNGVLKDGKVLTKELRPSAFVGGLPFVPKRLNQRTRIHISKWIITTMLILSIWLSFTFIQAIINKPFSFDSFMFIFQMVFVAFSYMFFGYPYWTTPVVPQELTKFYDSIV